MLLYALQKRKDLEAQMAQFQLELDAIELQTKHQRFQAKANILESYHIALMSVVQ